MYLSKKNVMTIKGVAITVIITMVIVLVFLFRDMTKSE